MLREDAVSRAGAGRETDVGGLGGEVADCDLVCGDLACGDLGGDALAVLNDLDACDDTVDDLDDGRAGREEGDGPAVRRDSGEVVVLCLDCRWSTGPSNRQSMPCCFLS